MKKNYLFLAASALMLGLSSCSTSEIEESLVPNPGEPATAKGVKFTAESRTETRTYMKPGAAAGLPTYYFWNPSGEYIYVKNGGWLKSTEGKNNPTDMPVNSRATFYFSEGTFTDPNYLVYYPGTGAGCQNNTVVIPAEQTQSRGGDCSHLGASGDCGVGVATKIGDGYRFDITHKASYLVFTPYISNATEQAQGLTVQSVTFSADKAVNGTFTLPATVSGSLTQTVAGTTSTKVTATIPVAVPATKSFAYAIYMVIAPGTYSNIKFTYTLKSALGAIYTVEIPIGKTTEFLANDTRRVPTDLSGRIFADYSSRINNYYQWGAQTNWPVGTDYDALPATSKYSTAAFPTPAPAGTPTASCPNVNELAWYLEKGNPTWDDVTSYIYDGKLRTGGLWLKKQSVIARENSTNIDNMKAAAPDGVNYITSTTLYNKNKTTATYPVGSINTNDYFFLPALGCISENFVINLGIYGYYWSCSSTPQSDNIDCTYQLYFLRTVVGVSGGINRIYGCQMWTAQ